MDLINYVKSSITMFLGEEDGYDYIDKKVDWKQAFVVFLIVSFVSSFITSIIDFTKTESIRPVWQLVSSQVLVSLVGGTIGVFLMYWLLQTFLSILGARGEFYDTMKFGLSISFLPSVLGLVFSIVGLIFYNDVSISDMNIYSLILLVILLLGLTIWTLSVIMRVFSKKHQVSQLRVLSAVGLSILILLAIVFVLALIVGVIATLMM